MPPTDPSNIPHTRRLCVAPMLDWTDRHCRYFLRLLSPHAWLYTEMITTGALIHGDQQRFLGFDDSEHPVALQLGGSDPEELAICAEKVEQAGFDEINLNVGCPSDRVQAGRFGACLMKEPGLVAECVDAMQRRVGIPVTVKHRIGVDEQEGYEPLKQFVQTVSQAGCNTFIVHARKAWLQGLNPKQNRDVPPLQYDMLPRLKQDFPELEFIANGGIRSHAEVNTQLEYADGVMIGREAYHNPYMLAELEKQLWNNDATLPKRDEVVSKYIEYAKQPLAEGRRLHSLSRHILGLYQAQPGARTWRRTLSELGCQADAGTEVIEEALARVKIEREKVENSDRSRRL